MARIAVVGPGAIGGIIAATLSRDDAHEVTVCARRPLSELVVETPAGEIVAKAKIITSPAEAPAVDWVLVATKTYDAESAAAWFPKLRAKGAPVAILQNGVEHVARFTPWVDPALIVPVLLYCPAERTSPTRIQQRREARVDVPDTSLGRDLAALFARTPIAVTPRPDIQTALWRKLGVNSVGVLNALLLKPTGVLNEPPVDDLSRAIARECIAVGRAEGAKLDDNFAEEILANYRANPYDSINSLHADRAANRPTELDARNGVIIRLGRKHGIPTPYNQMAVWLLEAMMKKG